MNFDRELREFKGRRHSLLASDVNTEPNIKIILNTIDDICRKVDKIDSTMDSLCESVDVDNYKEVENSIKKINTDFIATVTKKRQAIDFTKDGDFKYDKSLSERVLSRLLSHIGVSLSYKIEEIRNNSSRSYHEKYKDQLR